jgi:hypothetical protein
MYGVSPRVNANTGPQQSRKNNSHGNRRDSGIAADVHRGQTISLCLLSFQPVRGAFRVMRISNDYFGVQMRNSPPQCIKLIKYNMPS